LSEARAWSLIPAACGGTLAAMSNPEPVLDALRDFAEAVKAKMNQLAAGEPEDQLRGPFENFMRDVGRALAVKIICTGESRLADRLGKPDFAIHSGGLLTGYVELKAPGTGALPTRFTGRNRDQWKRFESVPNLLYSDGNEWGLYRTGKAARPLVRAPLQQECALAPIAELVLAMTAAGC
jgi:hypothetical protein